MKTLFGVIALATAFAGADPGDRLDQARMLIFDRDWPRAVVELRRVLDDPKEPLHDEASFWLAHSLFQMGEPGEALVAIETIERRHPRSRWMLPAQSLRVEIATRTGRRDMLWRIAVKPTPPPSIPGISPPPTGVTVHPTPRPARTPRVPAGVAPPAAPDVPTPPAPPPAPAPPGLTFIDVQIQALSGLLTAEPQRAVPVLREIVVDTAGTPQSRRALFVLGLSAHEDARETVIHFAQNGPEELRVVAVEQLKRFPALTARTVLTSVYANGTRRVKLEVLRSMREAGADRELIRIARTEQDAPLRGYAIAQLREMDTDVARAYLRTLK